MRAMKSGLAWAAFICLAVGTFQPYYWRIFTVDRAATRAWMTELPYQKMPGLRAFMTAVQESTPEGAWIAIGLPYTEWEAYSYGFFRSTYLLAGRRTVPLASTRGAVPENLRYANYLASWRGAPEVEGFEPVLRHQHGVLLRRIR